MDMFHFGKRHTILTDQGNPREVGEYFLHVQCAWRILSPGSIVVASRDRWYPDDETDTPPADFDWTQPGNRCDKRLAAFIHANAEDDSLVVTAVAADRVGSVKLQLAKGVELDIFPDDSFEAEHWRFFQTDKTVAPFVVTGRRKAD
jgi:hypothetical protein